MTLANIANWIIPFSAIIIAIVYSFSKLREKTDDQNKNLIMNLEKERDLYKERAERLEREGRDREAQHQRQMNELNKELGVVKGSLEQMAKQNEMYLAILKDKNPEQIEFMKLLSESAKESARLQKNAEKYMQNTASILKEIHGFMQSLNKKAIENEKRNYRVDNGPAHKRDKSIVNIKKMSVTSKKRDEAIDSKGGVT